MFTVRRVVRIPDFIRMQICAQIVNMPVEPVGVFAVMLNPGFYPTRAEGTADIDIIAGPDLKGAEFSDHQFCFSRGWQDDCVCAGERVHGGEPVTSDEFREG